MQLLAEYITLRLLRKFFFTTNLLTKIGKFVPYFRVNQNQIDPKPTVEMYISVCKEKNIDLGNRTILEIGSGATNSVGYELSLTANFKKIWLCEPFINFQEKADKEYKNSIKSKNPMWSSDIVERVSSLIKIPEKSVDIIFSSAVLEHVLDFNGLLKDLIRILKPDGKMIHKIDYRDHFFKYPYHFLQFSKKVWNMFLNPGDLPRWRISDHIEGFKQLGLKAEIINMESIDIEFYKIKKYIHKDFLQIPENELKISLAILFIQYDI